ncbi:AIM32 Altered inheritance of mitochondria protein 32 [Candida maltosa Xu316]|uniref:Altered inheritance of mitochondria protein 32 n=1 Tax=Candida maltosa (strain Xu316) TaxID=1245528 RepID=M3J5X0_CANMX|nr:hypothetical protein G210_2231 [Candida maltosa Xu316]
MFIHRIPKRFYSRINWKLQESCGVPQYDTGCTYCQADIPSDLPIDYETSLTRTSAVPTKHVMILSQTPVNKLPSKIELIPGSIPNEIIKYKKLYQTNTQRVLISNIFLNNQKSVLDNYGVSGGKQLVMLYPDMKIIKFQMNHLDQFVQKYLFSKQEPVYNPFAPAATDDSKDSDDIIVEDENFEEFSIDKDMILTCGHKARDLRCGIISPLLLNEIDSVLKKKNMEDDVYVGEISHIGGHAYAGNLLYYPKDCESDRDFIWYGRVFPDKIQGIIDDTVIDKSIIKNLFRGDVDRYL